MAIWTPTWRTREEIALERIRLLLEIIANFLTRGDNVRILALRYAEILRTGRVFESQEDIDIPEAISAQNLIVNTAMEHHAFFPLINPTAFSLLRRLLIKIVDGKRNLAGIDYTVVDPDPIGSKGILPVRSAPLGVAEAEQMALDDYRLVLNQTISAREASGIQYLETTFEPTFMVVVDQTPEADILHWNDEYLDPYWNLRPVQAQQPSLWTYGRGYEVPLEFTEVQNSFIQLIVAGLRTAGPLLIENWREEIRDRGLFLMESQVQRLAE